MKRLLTAIALACAAQMAWSADAGIGQGGAPVAGGPSASDADRLGALQSQIQVLKAEAEIAKLNADIANAGKDQAKAGGMIEPAAAGTLGPVVVPPAQRNEPMRALLVSSYDGRFTAVIDVAGRPIRVRKGDVIVHGWRVLNISRMGVELERGRRVRWLEL